jgi:hypothetical protein
VRKKGSSMKCILVTCMYWFKWGYYFEENEWKKFCLVLMSATNFFFFIFLFIFAFKSEINLPLFLYLVVFFTQLVSIVGVCKRTGWHGRDPQRCVARTKRERLWWRLPRMWRRGFFRCRMTKQRHWSYTSTSHEQIAKAAVFGLGCYGEDLAKIWG